MPSLAFDDSSASAAASLGLASATALLSDTAF